jgi:integrase
VPIVEEQRRIIAEARLGNAKWVDQDLIWPRMPKIYSNTNGADAVARFGSPLKPDSVRRILSRSANLAKIGSVRPHDLRHTRASLLISEEVNIKIVSAHLRHSSTQMTWDTYGHLYPDDQAQAAQKLGSIFEAPISAKMG